MRNLKDSGYTIVELLVAIIVGGVIIGAAQVLVVSHSHLSQRTRDVTVANAYAEKKVESLRSSGYLTLTDGTIDLTSELPLELKTPRSGTLTISSQTSAIKRVNVSMTYNDQGVARTYQYTTYIGELGVGQ